MNVNSKLVTILTVLSYAWTVATYVGCISA